MSSQVRAVGAIEIMRAVEMEAAAQSAARSLPPS